MLQIKVCLEYTKQERLYLEILQISHVIENNYKTINKTKEDEIRK